MSRAGSIRRGVTIYVECNTDTIRAVLLFSIVAWSANIALGDLVLSPAELESATGQNIGREVLVSGSGNVNGSNDPAAPWIMDGAVQGISLESPIVVTGYVKGTGTFDNVVFDGTFSPGHSPALITLGNTIYTASNVLEMEIGGLSPGSQHDKIVHNGMAVLGGTLDVVLINAFMPQLGHTFDLFNWNAGNSGTFATINLPALQSGLAWDASDLYIGGALAVTAIPEAGGFWLIGICACAVMSTAAIRRVWQLFPRGATAPSPPRAADTFGGKHMAKVLKRRLLLIALAATTVFVAGRPAWAVTHTWNGNINSMSTGTWIGGTPVSGSMNLTLIFPVPVMMLNTNLNQDIANPLEVQALQIDGPYNFNGNQIRLKNLGAAPTIDMPGNSFVNISFNAPLDFNAATTISNTGTSFKNVTFDTLQRGGDYIRRDRQLAIHAVRFNGEYVDRGQFRQRAQPAATSKNSKYGGHRRQPDGGWRVCLGYNPRGQPVCRRHRHQRDQRRQRELQ